MKFIHIKRWFLVKITKFFHNVPNTRRFSTNIEKQALFTINRQEQDLVAIHVVKLIY